MYVFNSSIYNRSYVENYIHHSKLSYNDHTPRYYLRSIGEKLTDAEMDSYIQPFNKGGKVKYEEFVSSLFR